VERDFRFVSTTRLSNSVRMNANLERRWIESEAQYETRDPKRSSPASLKVDSATTGPVDDDHVVDRIHRGNGSVNDAAAGRVNNDLLGDSEEDENDASGWTDLFSDPDPIDEFQFRFDLPLGPVTSSDSAESSAPTDESKRSIDISLVGYKAELGQTLHSTGLTLWRASSLLCDFLLQHPWYVRGKSVIEVRFETRKGGGGYCCTAHRVSVVGSHTTSLTHSSARVWACAASLPATWRRRKWFLRTATATRCSTCAPT
jgi:hypothetical protein